MPKAKIPIPAGYDDRIPNGGEALVDIPEDKANDYPYLEKTVKLYLDSRYGPGNPAQRAKSASVQAINQEMSSGGHPTQPSTGLVQQTVNKLRGDTPTTTKALHPLDPGPMGLKMNPPAPTPPERDLTVPEHLKRIGQAYWNTVSPANYLQGPGGFGMQEDVNPSEEDFQFPIRNTDEAIGMALPSLVSGTLHASPKVRGGAAGAARGVGRALFDPTEQKLGLSVPPVGAGAIAGAYTGGKMGYPLLGATVGGALPVIGKAISGAAEGAAGKPWLEPGLAERFKPTPPPEPPGESPRVQSALADYVRGATSTEAPPSPPPTATPSQPPPPGTGVGRATSPPVDTTPPQLGQGPSQGPSIATDVFGQRMGTYYEAARSAVQHSNPNVAAEANRVVNAMEMSLSEADRARLYKGLYGEAPAAPEKPPIVTPPPDQGVPPFNYNPPGELPPAEPWMGGTRWSRDATGAGRFVANRGLNLPEPPSPIPMPEAGTHAAQNPRVFNMPGPGEPTDLVSVKPPDSPSEIPSVGPVEAPPPASPVAPVAPVAQVEAQPPLRPPMAPPQAPPPPAPAPQAPPAPAAPPAPPAPPPQAPPPQIEAPQAPQALPPVEPVPQAPPPAAPPQLSLAQRAIQGSKGVAPPTPKAEVLPPLEQPKAPMAPEGEPSKPFLEGLSGDRWQEDQGSMPGEPAYYLDLPEDGELHEAKAAIIENDKGGTSTWEAVLPDGKSLGEFNNPEDAAKAAEFAIDNPKRAKTTEPKAAPKTIEAKAEPGPVTPLPSGGLAGRAIAAAKEQPPPVQPVRPPIAKDVAPKEVIPETRPGYNKGHIDQISTGTKDTKLQLAMKRLIKANPEITAREAGKKLKDLFAGTDYTEDAYTDYADGIIDTFNEKRAREVEVKKEEPPPPPTPPAESELAPEVQKKVVGRNEVLDFLKRRRDATLDQVQRALGLPGDVAMGHIRELMKSGLIDTNKGKYNYKAAPGEKPLGDVAPVAKGKEPGPVAPVKAEAAEAAKGEAEPAGAEGDEFKPNDKDTTSMARRKRRINQLQNDLADTEDSVTYKSLQNQLEGEKKNLKIDQSGNVTQKKILTELDNTTNRIDTLEKLEEDGNITGEESSELQKLYKQAAKLETARDREMTPESERFEPRIVNMRSIHAEGGLRYPGKPYPEVHKLLSARAKEMFKVDSMSKLSPEQLKQLEDTIKTETLENEAKKSKE